MRILLVRSVLALAPISAALVCAASPLISLQPVQPASDSHYTARRGYSGDLTLLGKPTLVQLKGVSWQSFTASEATPQNFSWGNTPAEKSLRFDAKLIVSSTNHRG